MGFFKDLTLSPRERKQNAKLRSLERQRIFEMHDNQAKLEEVKELTLMLFQMSVENDADWNETVKATKDFREVSLKANSAESLIIACEMHSMAYMKRLINRYEIDNYEPKFANISFDWWQVFEDLRLAYAVSRQINLPPERIEGILETLAYIDKLIDQSKPSKGEKISWLQTRVDLMREYPALPNIEFSD